MHRVLILGGGFAAVAAAERLLQHGRDLCEITIVSSSPTFIFYPALVPLVFDRVDVADVSFDLKTRLRANGVRFIEGEVIDIDAEMQTVTVTGDDAEGRIHFDYLVIALGRRIATEKLPGFFERSHHLLSVEAALKFRSAIEKFTKGNIVVGLAQGAALPVPVCETALSLAGMFRPLIASNEVSVTSVFPATLDQSLRGADLLRDLRAEFATRGVNLVENFPAAQITETQVISVSGSAINHDLLMFVPPFQGQSPLAHMTALTNDAGFAETNSLLQVAGNSNIYAAGDCVSLPGPKFGYMAIRQGRIAADNINAQLHGNPAFAEYDHEIAWILGERHSEPTFFHYGVWDDTLGDFEKGSLFGMASDLREKYGKVMRRESRVRYHAF